MNQQKRFPTIPFATKSGFTLVEVMVVVVVIGIMSAITVPSIIAWLPNYKLKSAARDLYSTLQQTRLLAIRENASVRIVFDNTVTPGFYFIDTDSSGTINLPSEQRTNLAGYGNGIDFGFPAGLVDWNGAGPAGSVVFAGNPGPPPFCTYNSNGTTGNGTIYLVNDQNHIVYAITTVVSGAIKLRKYSGILPYNQNNWIE